MYQYRLRIVGAILLWFCTIAYSSAAQWTVDPLPINKSEHDPRSYQSITLANGMRILLVSDSQAASSLAALALPVGSLEDPNSQLGLAHYTEHMVLMGSRHYPQPESFSEFLKKHGGHNNASTGSYRTAYYLEVDNNALPEAVARLADAIASPLLDASYADKERNAVNAELTMARSRDGHRMGQVRAETLNPAHPAARFSGGNLETLRDKPGSNLHDELLNFYQRFYSANLMVGVIYSNRPLTDLAKLAAETFGQIANHQAQVPTITVPTVTAQQQGILIHYVPAQPRKLLRIEFAIENNSADFQSKSDSYIAYLLGNRSRNTLADWLKKQGLADDIDAGVDPMVNRNQGVFAISVSLTDKGMLQRDLVVAAIFSYLKQIRQQGINAEYFDEMAKILQLDFHYPAISRDMSYVESLADNMLRVPVEHVLDSHYLATQFTPQTIAARLDQLTPEHARIWFIGPDEPHDKQAYFVNAPYQVAAISEQQLALWKRMIEQVNLSLPTKNPYIPNNLDLVGRNNQMTRPALVLDKPGVRVFHMPSHYFADQPKADISLALRNPKAQDSAKNQVLYALNDYLFSLAFDQVSYQASVGGVTFSTSSHGGVLFRIQGFSQYLPQLIDQLMIEFPQVSPTQEQLQQAKSWYLQQLDIADNAKAFELALYPVQRLSSLPYIEPEVRRKLIESITAEEITDYRRAFIHDAALEMLVVGNISAEQSGQLALQLQEKLGTARVNQHRGPVVVVDDAKGVLFEKPGKSSDAALAAVYIPTGYDELTGRSYSLLAERILQPWFYNQLRTQEQLGYAVFAFSMAVGKQWGIGFLLQSNNQSPAFLYQRYQAFYDNASQRLAQMQPAEFAQYQQGLLNELTRTPQTIHEEADRFINDFNRGNEQFDSREKLIALVKQASLAQLNDYFKRAVMAKQGLAVLSQIVGQGQAPAQYATPDGWTLYPSVSSLQQQLPQKNEEK